VTDNQGEIQTGTTITAIGLFFYIWFLGSLRTALSRAEGGEGRLASVAYGGGLVSAGFFLVGLTTLQAAAFRTDDGHRGRRRRRRARPVGAGHPATLAERRGRLRYWRRCIDEPGTEAAEEARS
jgi:hypothetical protein